MIGKKSIVYNEDLYLRKSGIGIREFLAPDARVSLIESDSVHFLQWLWLLVINLTLTSRADEDE